MGATVYTTDSTILIRNEMMLAGVLHTMDESQLGAVAERSLRFDCELIHIQIREHILIFAYLIFLLFQTKYSMSPLFISHSTYK